MDVDNINVVLVVVASAITDNILVSSVNVANIESWLKMVVAAPPPLSSPHRLP